MTTKEATATADTFTMMSVNMLRESKTNPRKHFKAVDELAENIKQHGVLTPLLVRMMGPDQYEVIAGARRFKASQIAKLTEVPVRILTLSDEQALEFQVLENLQREDVHPIDEAAGFKKLLDAGKYDITALAIKINKSETYIRTTLILNKLIPTAVKACFEEKITAGHAKLLARLEPAAQVETLKVSLRGDYSVRGLADHIENQYHLELSKAPWPLDDAKLLPSAGACIDCPKRTGANPGLFPDIKKKDTCTDPTCFKSKLVALVQRNKASDLVSISVSWPSYNEKKIDGVIYPDSYRPAGGVKCESTKQAIVVIGADYRTAKVGQEASICIDVKCKTHGERAQRGGGTSHKDPAQAAKERRDRAISDARTEATRQIFAKAKWPISPSVLKSAVMSWYGRITYDGQKLACKILGIWPTDGKLANFDFRAKLEKFVAGSDQNTAAKILMVFTVLPEYGSWGGGYSGDAKEKALLHGIGRTLGVNVAKIENRLIKESHAKAAAKAKAKAKAAAKAKKLAKAKPKSRKAA